jgi:hypothetical protein
LERKAINAQEGLETLRFAAHLRITRKVGRVSFTLNSSLVVICNPQKYIRYKEINLGKGSNVLKENT